MKIIALLPSSYGSPGAIVQLSGDELDQIVSAKDHTRAAGVGIGCEVHISERWRHLRNIEDKAGEAKSLPRTLRTLADMIELSLPSIREVVAKPTQAEAS